MIKTQEILIVGAGFAGVQAARNLENDPRFNVTILSEDMEMRYYPTLYRTATGGIRANSSIPLEKIFENTQNITIVKGTATTLDKKAKTITTADDKKYTYDVLILALGVVTNYFGIPGLAEYSYSIKSQSEVARFKAHLHKQIQDERRPDLNYVIVGAGPTGIELAGALPGYLSHIMKNHGVSNAKAIHIDLIEAAPQLLPRLPKSISRTVRRRLHDLGIKLYVNSVVQAESKDGLTVSGKPIRSHTVIWTAGVTNHPFFAENHFAIMGRGKVAVDVYLQADENVYVLGDNANTPYSGMAQTALLDGKFVAMNLKRKAEGKNPKSYNAKQPVTIIPAGPKWAVVIWRKVHFHGYLGHLLRQASEFVGFHDLENWPLATKQFLTEFSSSDDCEVCAASSNAAKG
ncbi:MAG: NAD(P)/FAD-dependent oxidoreductase [Candidatus Saccharimonadales bacterium]